jgi:hypothetical protein
MNKFLSWVAGIGAAALFAGFITAMIMGSLQSAEYRRKCIESGNVYISNYCVKPNSVVEVK